jgi:hypothetical protein
MSERTTSDMEFVRLFSPKILEKLAEDAFEGAVHVFRRQDYAVARLHAVGIASILEFTRSP